MEEKKLSFTDAMLERCMDRRNVIRCYMSNGYQVKGLVEDFDDQYVKIRLPDRGSRYLNRSRISAYEPNPPRMEGRHGSKG